MYYERRIANTKGIYSLLYNWSISIGSLVIVIVLSLYISKLWLPIIVFGIEILLYYYVRHNSKAKFPTCMKIPHITMISLFWSAVVMSLVNLYHYQNIVKVAIFSDTLNKEIPYVSILIIAPVTFIVVLLNVVNGFNSIECRDCQARNGSIPERGFLGKLYSQEGEYLSRMLLMFAFILTVICWSYYFVFYINTNINNIDRFVFVWGPVIIFLLTVIYLSIRYSSLWLYYCQDIEGQSLRFNSSSLVRFLVICDDYIFLKIPGINDDLTVDADKIDTPARLYVKYKKEITPTDAMFYFVSMSGITDAEVKFLYKNINFNSECNLFHYAFFVNDKSIVDNSRLEGDWYTLSQIESLIKEHKMSLIFISELERIYKIALTWKTYDIKGNRLYDMKHYRPTFRLRDMKNWDVDYNDSRWLYVSKINSDSRFYLLQNLWNKYVCGIRI